MSKVAILITIHEGDDGSSGCLEECQKQIDAVASEGKYSFSIFLNDAGENGCQAVWESASKEGADFYISTLLFFIKGFQRDSFPLVGV